MVANSLQITDEQVTQIATEYGLKLQDVFEAVEIRLFGSYLKHNANSYSDLDLAVVSRDFAGMELYTAMKILNRVKLQVNNIIEPIPVTPDELNNPEVGSLTYDIAKENKILFKAPY
jgi:predicted nucleotidyltransferase